MMGDGPAAFDPTEFCCLFPSNFIFLPLYRICCYIQALVTTSSYLWISAHYCICGWISVFVAVLVYLLLYYCICGRISVFVA